MDANRSLIVIGFGAVVVLAVLMALLPLLMQGIDSKGVRSISSRAVTDELYEDLDREQAAYPPPAPTVRRARRPSAGLAEAWTPQTLSEKRWAESVAHSQARAEEAEQEEEKFSLFRAFMATSEGGDIQAAFELLRRGKAEDAAKLLENALPALGEQPFEIQQPLLARAIRLFEQAKRLDLMGQSLVVYLENLRDKIEAGGLDGRTKQNENRLLEDVNNTLAEVRSRAGGAF